MRQRQADATAPGPLAGVRAIELASVVMGPLAGQILGDLGADVIKVEVPQGEFIRRSPLVFPGTKLSAMNCTLKSQQAEPQP